MKPSTSVAAIVARSGGTPLSSQEFERTFTRSMKPPRYSPVLDSRHAIDRHRTYAAATPEPKTAMSISLETGQSLPNIVDHLRQLELRGTVTHTADEQGVLRWARREDSFYDAMAPF